MEKFIADQIAMLNSGYSEEQIRDNVYRRVFKDGVPNMTIDAMIKACMQVYSYIMIKYAFQEINPTKND